MSGKKAHSYLASLGIKVSLMDQTCRRSNTSSTDVEEAGISSPRPTSHVVFIPAEDLVVDMLW